MKFGLAFANTMNFTTLDGLRTLATSAEAAGFESVWTVEHVIFPDGYESRYPYDPSGKMPMAPSTPLPDPLIWLSFIAGVTTTLRLATGILILPQRNPVVLAKEIATLDALSGGRVELGVGVGWLREEFDALGVPWEQRGARTDDYIAAMRALWGGDSVDYRSAFTQFTNVSSNPKPVTGRVPIHIGGHSAAAAARAGRIGDGFFPGTGNIAELVAIVHEHAEKAGRDPADVEITYGSPGLFGSDPIGAVQELESQGVSRAILPAFIFLNDTADALAAFGERVIAASAKG